MPHLPHQVQCNGLVANLYTGDEALCHADDLGVDDEPVTDGTDFAEATRDLDSAETLFIISSKTFTTLETMTNAQTARQWVIEALGSFLLAFVLLVFAYSTYFLFVHDEVDEERQKRIRMPAWLQVEDLDEMKQVLLRVIMVLLSVYLLQLVFVEGTDLAWTTLILPASIVAIADYVNSRGG